MNERLAASISYSKTKCKSSHLPGLFIYLLKCGKFYKVGIATDPDARRAQCQTGNPHEIRLIASWKSPDAYAEERSIHELLRPYHHRGEWFKLPRELVDKLLAG